jgi:peptidylprolyl isomerase
MRYFISAVFAALVVFGSVSAWANTSSKEAYMLMELKSGTVKIALRDDLAPKHVERIKQLVGEKFYDGIIFHRVIDGFMAQTGDPTGTGMGGSDYPDLRAEFSNEPFRRGTLGMARSQHPDSANSQFFICFEDAAWLNGQYTVFGEVVEGMEHIDAITRGEPPAEPDQIISLTLAD